MKKSPLLSALICYAVLLVGYIVANPILFSFLHPTSGDVSLIWIWVAVVSFLNSLVSLFGGAIFLTLIKHKVRYYIICAFSLLVAVGLATYVGEGLNTETALPFFTSNSLLLLIVHGVLLLYMNRKHHERRRPQDTDK